MNEYWVSLIPILIAAGITIADTSGKLINTVRNLLLCSITITLLIYCINH